MAIVLDTREYITIAMGCVTTVAVLIVGYLHRKQMRQIEAFKINPSVGLKPPPNAVRMFLKSNILLLCAAVAVVFLITDVLSKAPVTRYEIFLIAVDVVSIFLFLIAHVVLKLLSQFGKVLSTIEDLAKISSMHNGMIMNVVDALKIQAPSTAIKHEQKERLE